MIAFAVAALLANADAGIPSAFTGVFGVSALTFDHKCPSGNTLFVTPDSIRDALDSYAVRSAVVSGNMLTVDAVSEDEENVAITLTRTGADTIDVSIRIEGEAASGSTAYQACTN
ncbi:MAG: hypothetical protein KF730_11220 [Sphingomonas sp.]|uniref:hypothetical protein n=1 Tax=Sphingomonas sp. TaxID=28214 RepID=UPI0025F1E5CC|nr:hypothetical protein [Sphingomonas sp.]MBX3565131.1 hypothetical protein [Sphingomonas sp.]